MTGQVVDARNLHVGIAGGVDDQDRALGSGWNGGWAIGCMVGEQAQASAVTVA